MREIARSLTPAPSNWIKRQADFRIALGGESPRQFWKDYLIDEQVRKAYDELDSQLSKLCDLLEELAVRSRDLENLHQRAVGLSHRSNQFMDIDEQEIVQWLEVYRKSFSLNSNAAQYCPIISKGDRVIP